MKPRKKFSTEVRASVVREYLDTEKSAREISDETGVSTASIGRWVREVRDRAATMSMSIDMAIDTWAIEDATPPVSSGNRRERTAVPV